MKVYKYWTDGVLEQLESSFDDPESHGIKLLLKNNYYLSVKDAKDGYIADLNSERNTVEQEIKSLQNRIKEINQMIHLVRNKQR